MTITGVWARVCLPALALTTSSWAANSVPSTGCGQSLPSGTYQLTDQNALRTYRLFVPSRYRPGTAYPLVMVFHGWGGDENEFLDDRTVKALAEERGYLVAAPRGLGSGVPDAKRNSWTFRGSATGLAGTAGDSSARRPGAAAAAICEVARTPNFTYPSCRNVARNTCSWTQCQADDVAFTLALVAELESHLCVDTARVFATGGSNGGMFTWELGQNTTSAPTFRAIASLIGLPHRGYLDTPGKSGALPVLLITGTRDPTVPPGAWESTAPTTTRDGSAYYYTGASAIVRRWGGPDSCPYRGKPAAPFDAHS